MSISKNYNDECENSFRLRINGNWHSVNRNEVPVDTSLNTYIRDYAKLSGTKFMCKEGGCGACLVTITSPHPVTGKQVTYAVNSCLFKVWSCANTTEVTTIEKAKDFKYPGAKLSLSDQLAMKNGSQCGYCSPGMVMNMYGLINGSTDKLKAKDVEFSFAGNICRCTGYKPILEAFKSIVEPSSVDTIDIEDVSCAQKCSRRRMISDDEEADYEACFLENALAPDTFSLKFKDGRCWTRPKSVKEIFEIFDDIKGPYMLISGNTAQGVSPAIFRDKPVQTYIDVRGVKELRQYSITNDGITIGANTTISDFIQVLRDAETRGQFKYASELAHHISLVANVPVRNTGTIAGNLMLKYAMYHQAQQMFQSDLFLLLELVNAQLSIKKLSGRTYTLTPSELMNKKSMDREVIVKITLPPLDSKIYMIRTYKIMPRAQNAPAAINAGFLFKMNSSKPKVIDQATVVYGGINPSFVHATNTEKYLKGKDLSNETDLQSAIEKLKQDLNNIPDGKDYLYPSAYRLQLSVNLLYKTFLAFNKKKKTKLNPLYMSGSQKLEEQRSTSGGKVDFINMHVDKARGKLIPKLEAFIQCKGEAEYVNDIPVIDGQLYAAMVIAPSGPGTLIKTDTTEAERSPGFVQFLSASDIPGKNTLFLKKLVTPDPEELFCSRDVKYAGQPVGVVIANSQDQANAAARKVKVSVSNTTALLSIDDVLLKYKKYPNERIVDPLHKTQPSSSFQQQNSETNIEDKGSKDDLIRISGEFNMGSQYHYSMELQTCAVVPIEDGQYDVFSATQWPLSVQEAIALVLGIQDNKVNVVVRRVGGAYGCKVTRAVYAAAACALASHKLKKPVRMVMDMETNTKAIGKRCALKCNYDLSVDKTGQIKSIDKLDFLDDKGITMNDPIYVFIPGTVQSCYDISSMLKLGQHDSPLKVYSVLTDTPGSSWCRAPGSLEGMSVIETIMNSIADRLPQLDPVQVRLNNINQNTNKPFYDFFQDRATSSSHINYKQCMHDVKTFNEANRWVKQGFSVIPMSFPIEFLFQFYCSVSVHEGDGSISITHGGTEIGQGINTKVAVAAAYIFGLEDTSLISVKPTSIIFLPNNTLTGGSLTSDATSYACMMCCEKIKERLDTLIKVKKLSPDIKWPDLIRQAYDAQVDLQATCMWKKGETPDPHIGSLDNYSVSGVCAAMVEVDILTGQHIVREVKLYEDIGKSFAPYIDLGQVQGAFVMGMGYFTSEEIVYNKETGELITNRTWNYDVPGALDIPETFHVTIENDPKLGGGEGTKPDYGVLGAKASGEPPLCLSLSVFFAIREAIRSARKDAHATEIDFKFEPPATVAQKVMNSSLNDKQFKIIN